MAKRNFDIARARSMPGATEKAINTFLANHTDLNTYDSTKENPDHTPLQATQSAQIAPPIGQSAAQVPPQAPQSQNAPSNPGQFLKGMLGNIFPNIGQSLSGLASIPAGVVQEDINNVRNGVPINPSMQAAGLIGKAGLGFMKGVDETAGFQFTPDSTSPMGVAASWSPQNILNHAYNKPVDTVLNALPFLQAAKGLGAASGAGDIADTGATAAPSSNMVQKFLQGVGNKATVDAGGFTPKQLGDAVADHGIDLRQAYRDLIPAGSSPQDIVGDVSSRFQGGILGDGLKTAESQLQDVVKGSGNQIIRSTSSVLKPVFDQMAALSKTGGNSAKVAAMQEFVDETKALHPNGFTGQDLLDTKRGADTAYGSNVVNDTKGAAIAQAQKLAGNSARGILHSEFPEADQALNTQSKIFALQPAMQKLAQNAMGQGSDILKGVNITQPATYVAPVVKTLAGLAGIDASRVAQGAQALSPFMTLQNLLRGGQLGAAQSSLNQGNQVPGASAQQSPQTQVTQNQQSPMVSQNINQGFNQGVNSPTQNSQNTGQNPASNSNNTNSQPTNNNGFNHTGSIPDNVQTSQEIPTITAVDGKTKIPATLADPNTLAHQIPGVLTSDQQLAAQAQINQLPPGPNRDQAQTSLQNAIAKSAANSTTYLNENGLNADQMAWMKTAPTEYTQMTQLHSLLDRFGAKSDQETIPFRLPYFGEIAKQEQINNDPTGQVNTMYGLIKTVQENAAQDAVNVKNPKAFLTDVDSLSPTNTAVANKAALERIMSQMNSQFNQYAPIYGLTNDLQLQQQSQQQPQTQQNPLQQILQTPQQPLIQQAPASFLAPPPGGGGGYGRGGGGNQPFNFVQFLRQGYPRASFGQGGGGTTPYLSQLTSPGAPTPLQVGAANLGIGVANGANALMHKLFPQQAAPVVNQPAPSVPYNPSSPPQSADQIRAHYGPGNYQATPQEMAILGGQSAPQTAPAQPPLQTPAYTAKPGSVVINPQVKSFLEKTVFPTTDPAQIPRPVAAGMFGGEGRFKGIGASKKNYYNINAVDSNPNQASSFKTPQAGVAAYTKLLQTRYKAALQGKNPDQVIQGIQNGGYAGDPTTYQQRAKNGYASYSDFIKSTPEYRYYAGQPN